MDIKELEKDVQEAATNLIKAHIAFNKQAFLLNMKHLMGASETLDKENNNNNKENNNDKSGDTTVPDVW